MSAYTFLWTGQTWEERATSRSLREYPFVDYVAGDARRPLTALKDGDEIFIVNVQGGRVRLGGRLVVDAGPVSEDAARLRLPAERLIGKPLYVLAKQQQLDRFRPDLFLPQEDALSLELVDVNGGIKRPVAEPENPRAVYRQEFRQPMRLTEGSAAMLRRRLGLNPPGTSDDRLASLVKDLSDLERTVPDKTEREILTKARLGQGRFRSDVITRWGLGEVCALTNVAIPELLTASHIVPWSECGNADRLNPMNGVLLAANADRLFDRALMSFEAKPEGFVTVLHPRIRVEAMKVGLKDGVRLKTDHLSAGDCQQFRKFMARHQAEFARSL